MTGKILGPQRLEYKSNEEYYVACWLHELMTRGYIHTYTYEPLKFELSPRIDVNWQKKLKTKVKSQSKMLKDSVSYSPDFEVIWNLKKSDGILTYNSKDSYVKIPLFYIPRGCLSSLLEVKGSFDRRGTERDTKTKMNWVLSKYGTNIDLVRPNKLFSKTFYPEAYLLTDSGNQDRKKRVKGKLVPLRDIVNNIDRYDSNNRR